MECFNELRWNKVKTGTITLPVYDEISPGLVTAVYMVEEVDTYDTVLQQKLVSASGEEKWEDVPIVRGYRWHFLV